MAYTKKQVAEITGIDPRLIHFYIANKAIIPRMRSGEGRGIRWVYTRQIVLDLLIIKELADFGINLGHVKKILERLRELIMLEATKGNQINNLYISRSEDSGFNVQAVKDREPGTIHASNSYFVINYKRLLEKLG